MTRTETSYLGTLGDRRGVNVARVEVGWWYDGLGGIGPETEYHSGYYLVHATGDEPEAQGEDGTIYAVFEDLTHAAMQARQRRLGFAGYDLEDISAA